MQLKKAQLTGTPSMRRSKLDAYFLLEQRWWWFCLVPAKRPKREHIQELEGSRRRVHPDYYVVLNGVATSQDELRATRLRFAIVSAHKKVNTMWRMNIPTRAFDTIEIMDLVKWFFAQ